MTYLVTEHCVNCKYTSCVEVCPVDCFHEGKNMVVINPEECIDCGICVPACPIDAILSDCDPGADNWLDINKKFSLIWPRINQKKDPLPDENIWKNTPNKSQYIQE